jgi:hypothetical protein
LTLASFYEHEGATDKLRKCLESLTRWRQEEIAIRGEPRFTYADGLVISRKQKETIEKDFWERVTKAIRRLSQQLDQPAVSGTASSTRATAFAGSGNVALPCLVELLKEARTLRRSVRNTSALALTT